MEEFLKTASDVWSSFTDSGAETIQGIAFVLSGHELNEFWALVILLGLGASLVLWMTLKMKRPKKISYLMEGGQRYYRP